ncbi:hypothetical protein TcG_09124 [Trypanosoma cruzi]|nr:hypothetical protein TcG_09124 [Trypanosoma cruzi]
MKKKFTPQQNKIKKIPQGAKISSRKHFVILHEASEIHPSLFIQMTAVMPHNPSRKSSNTRVTRMHGGVTVSSIESQASNVPEINGAVTRGRCCIVRSANRIRFKGGAFISLCSVNSLWRPSLSYPRGISAAPD